MLIINSQNNNNNKIWKCRPPLFELLLIIRHKSADLPSTYGILIYKCLNLRIGLNLSAMHMFWFVNSHCENLRISLKVNTKWRHSMAYVHTRQVHCIAHYDV